MLLFLPIRKRHWPWFQVSFPGIKYNEGMMTYCYSLPIILGGRETTLFKGSHEDCREILVQIGKMIPTSS